MLLYNDRAMSGQLIVFIYDMIMIIYDIYLMYDIYIHDVRYIYDIYDHIWIVIKVVRCRSS